MLYVTASQKLEFKRFFSSALFETHLFVNSQCLTDFRINNYKILGFHSSDWLDIVDTSKLYVSRTDYPMD